MNCPDFFDYTDLLDFDIEIIKAKKTHNYFNIPAAFDIETSSFYDAQNRKTGIMYAWCFGINGKVCRGRTWDEFLQVISFLIEKLNISLYNRLIVYVHNLAYEFQFLQKLFVWEKVFAIDSRKPIYALTADGIEFRCSYLLSGYALETIGKNLQKYHVEKLVGELDYTKIRHSETPLTEKEWAYIRNDVLVVMAYIQEKIETDGDITKIPLTKTGYVRNYCRNCCMQNTPDDKYKRNRYYKMIHTLNLSGDEYVQLKQAFQGGFTHANPFYADKVVENVTSYDFTSSYPAVMVAEQFPMSSGELYFPHDWNDFEKNLRLYCCLFEIEFFDLESVLFYDSYISVSRCRFVEKAVINNGRVVSAKHLVTTITEQDFAIIRRFYTWGKMKIANFRRYQKDYLPTDFVKAILKLYQDKTQLKGVDGKEAEYLASKEMLNSCYG